MMKSKLGIFTVGPIFLAPCAAADITQLTDNSHLKYSIVSNVGFATTASASGAASGATYTQAVAVTTANGGAVNVALSESFDGYGALLINPGSAPLAGFAYNGNGVATTECGGRQVVLNAETIGNLSVRRKVYVPDNDAFCRWMNIITNNGGSTETVTIQIYNDLESDNLTKIVSSSDGDAVAETGDTWVTTFQDYTGTTSGDLRLGHVIQGTRRAASASQVSFANGNDKATWNFTFDIPAGQTRIVLNFVTGQPSKAAAATKAAQLAEYPASARACMTEAEIGQVINFSIVDCNANNVSDDSEPDTDADGVIDGCDNCVNAANTNQADSDGDGTGDACDSAPSDPNGGATDSDGDGIADGDDNCPNKSNADQADSDEDDIGDACDNAPSVSNPDQSDSDGDGVPNVIDVAPNDSGNNLVDSDADGIADDADNCPNDENADQADSDGDGTGDACQSSIDSAAACGACGGAGLAMAPFMIAAYAGALAGRRRIRGR